MAFEGLQDRLKEQWAELSAKIQESSLFNTARENFESQTPPVQKAIIAGAISLVVLLVFSFPYGYLSESSDFMTSFEENRGLIQGLLRASRTAKESSPLPTPVDTSQLRELIQQVMREKKLVPEQIEPMQDIPGKPAKNLAPEVVVQNGVAATITKLNLLQIIDIGAALQNMGLGTKLIGMDIFQTPGQTHYYSVVFKVVNFGLPLAAEPEADSGAKGGRKDRKAKRDQPEGEE